MNKGNGIKHTAFLLVLAFVLFCSVGCGDKTQESASSYKPVPEKTQSEISFVDDDGEQICFDKPFERIISLYSAHTENLYSLGAGDAIIGVHDTSTYPVEAAFKPQYDYNADPETIIAANPDCVLIRPFISRRVPDFVQALKNAGITVVSLYPERLEDFDDYIQKLAMLTGTEEKAKEELQKFHESIDAIQAITSTVEKKQKVFFESTQVNTRTVTPDSMAGLAITFSGGENVASDVTPVNEGSSIAEFGEERVLSLADEIDVYVLQRGAMNAGGDLQTIRNRPGYDSIKAVQDGRVYVIDEKIISSPTFRYVKGVRELARYLYPDLMDSVEAYQKDDVATKRDLANILVRMEHMPIFVSSQYDTQVHSPHIYGMFEDVPFTQEDFDYIETAVKSGAVGYEVVDDKEYFYPDEPVTRQMLAQTIDILYDFENKDVPISIGDLKECEEAKVVQNLVDHGIFPLIDGNFEPQREVSCHEIIEILTVCRQQLNE